MEKSAEVCAAHREIFCWIEYVGIEDGANTLLMLRAFERTYVFGIK